MIILVTLAQELAEAFIGHFEKLILWSAAVAVLVIFGALFLSSAKLAPMMVLGSRLRPDFQKASDPFRRASAMLDRLAEIRPATRLTSNSVKIKGQEQENPLPAPLMCDNVLYHTLMNTAGDGIDEVKIAIQERARTLHF